MGLRTLAEIQEEYTEARAAYRRALKAEQYSKTTGGETRSVGRPKSEELRQQVKELAAEYDRANGGGIVLGRFEFIDG